MRSWTALPARSTRASSTLALGPPTSSASSSPKVTARMSLEYLCLFVCLSSSRVSVCLVWVSIVPVCLSFWLVTPGDPKSQRQCLAFAGEAEEELLVRTGPKAGETELMSSCADLQKTDHSVQPSRIHPAPQLKTGVGRWPSTGSTPARPSAASARE